MLRRRRTPRSVWPDRQRPLARARLAAQPAAAALDRRFRSLREPRPGSLTANFHVVATVGAEALSSQRARRLRRLRGGDGLRPRRHADPARTRSATEAFGIWAFIGSDHDLPRRARHRPGAVGGPLHRGGARTARPGGDQPGRLGGARALRGDRRAHARRGRGALVVRADPDRDARRPRLGRAGRHVPRDAVARRPLPARALLQPARAAGTASTFRTSATSSRRCSTRCSSRS